MTDVSFRELADMNEFRAAEALQGAVWGDGDTPDPADLMKAIQAEGGLVGGAFQGDLLVGYVFGFPTRNSNIQHSHRLAVLPEARGRGLGLQLKLFQRRWCLARGINHVRWTFDPMRPANAALNITRLGVRCNTYLVDYYGAMEGINKGLPSDRLLVDWYLEDADVVALSEGRKRPAPAQSCLRVAVEDDVDVLMERDVAKALSERLRLRETLLDAFGQGRSIVGFEPVNRQYILDVLGPI